MLTWSPAWAERYPEGVATAQDRNRSVSAVVFAGGSKEAGALLAGRSLAPVTVQTCGALFQEYCWTAETAT